MGCPTGPGDDAAETTAGGILGVPVEEVRSPVSGDDAGFMLDLKVQQPLSGVLHHLPVGVAAHHDPHDGLGHGLFLRSGGAGLVVTRQE
jgi:hypothetical protein